MYQTWFLEYASYVILERAVPHIDDGLKPVQRRILHAMRTIHDGRFNKVANIVGTTMQYHPHGDASIKDALVQLGQKELLVEPQETGATSSPAAPPLPHDTSRHAFRLSPLEVPLQPQGYPMDNELRRPQTRTCDPSGEIPPAAGSGRRRHSRGSVVQNPAPQLQRNPRRRHRLYRRPRVQPLSRLSQRRTHRCVAL